MDRAAPEAVERLLRQLVDASFFLTDRDGSVTRWGRPAEELFGWAAAQTVGRSLFEVLAIDAQMLASGGRVRGDARRKDGSRVDVGLTLVPVSMSQSLEFNGFLEALEIVAPRGRALDRLQESHRCVVNWIAAAMVGHADFSDDEPAAGTIVTFEALGQAPPPVVEELPEPKRAPGVAAPSAAVVAHAEELGRSLAETRSEAAAAAARVQALETTGARLEGELVETRGAVGLVRDLVDALRGELDQARDVSDQTRAGLEEVREAISDRRGEQALRAELEQTRSSVAELERAVADTSSQEDLRTRLDQAREELGALRQASVRGPGREELEAALDQTRSKLATLSAAVAEAAAQDDLRAELAEARATLDDLGAQVADRSRDRGLRDEMERVRTAAEQAATAARDSLESDLTQTRALVAELQERLERHVDRPPAFHAAPAPAHPDEAPVPDPEPALAEARALVARLEEALAASEARAGEAAAASEAARELSEQATRAAQEAGGGSAAALEAATAAEGHAATAEGASERIERQAATAEQAVGRATEAAAAAERVTAGVSDAAAGADHAVKAERAAASAAEHEAASRGAAAERAEAAAERAGSAGRDQAPAAAPGAEPPVSEELSDERRPLLDRRRAVAPPREPRTGFDDVSEPLATIGLEGRFGALNRAFSDLVGYPEEEFRAATWPPVTDRAKLPEHREQMRRMLEGEIDSAEVNTAYMHAQGLLVPVVGTLSLVREAGEPKHFLLDVTGSQLPA